MSNDNIDAYLNIINDTLTNLQEDFDFLYEAANKRPKEQDEEKIKLLEEIAQLKTHILTLETNRNMPLVVNKIESLDGELQARIEHLESKLQDAQFETLLLNSKVKSLQNEIIDLKGAIRVFLRIRHTGELSNIEIQNNKISILHLNRTHNFEYDRVFTPDDSQQEVYNELLNIIESACDGYKICIFVYGQTGSGKTYTMIGTETQPGIIYKTLNTLFSVKTQLEKDVNNNFKLEYSCIEIYNEEVIDLNMKNNHFSGKTINLTSLEEAYDLITKTLSTRRTEKTNCNLQSSRSHLIFTLHIETKVNNETRVGTLCFIDLAGSERINQSQVEGMRLKETVNINKSLSSLGNVFMAILRKDSHIPYRNSKLTHQLQEYFTGKSRVVMILNINSGVNQRNETISTLRFGAKVSECKLGRVEKNITKNL